MIWAKSIPGLARLVNTYGLDTEGAVDKQERLIVDAIDELKEGGFKFKKMTGDAENGVIITFENKE